MTQKLSEWANRRNICKLGVIIINEIQEEMSNGISIMESMAMDARNNSHAHPTRLMPIKSWVGMKTAPDELMLRIVAINPSIVLKVRSDCKNYFEHVCVNINSAIKADVNCAHIVDHYIEETNDSNYLVAARNLYNELDGIKNSLIKNSKKLSLLNGMNEFLC